MPLQIDSVGQCIQLHISKRIAKQLPEEPLLGKEEGGIECRAEIKGLLRAAGGCYPKPRENFQRLSRWKMVTGLKFFPLPP